MTVIIFATAFKPLSVASARLEERTWDGRRLPAKPLAKAGNAKLWVNVSLWIDWDKLLWPILLRVAARSKAYSRSSASNREYLIAKRVLFSQLGRIEETIRDPSLPGSHDATSSSIPRIRMTCTQLRHYASYTSHRRCGWWRTGSDIWTVCCLFDCNVFGGRESFYETRVIRMQIWATGTTTSVRRCGW